jgi:hypothetical protein
VRLVIYRRNHPDGPLHLHDVIEHTRVEECIESILTEADTDPDLIWIVEAI